MKWIIPAKTFLLGEYAALAGAPGIVLTTKPCFELTLSKQVGLEGIHPESPAGRWWRKQGEVAFGLQWFDPYLGRGGMGASSAQFLGTYLATEYLKQNRPTQAHMLAAYIECAWSLEGIAPSAYDVQAQSLSGVVYIDRQHNACQMYDWPFEDIDFVLLHTGQKLATHQHLQAMELPNHMDVLAAIVHKARIALEQSESELMVDAVNAYHHALEQMHLVAAHSLQQMDALRGRSDVLAIKGCGAMGADVLLLLVKATSTASIRLDLSQKGWTLLATSADLYRENALIKK